MTAETFKTKVEKEVKTVTNGVMPTNADQVWSVLANAIRETAKATLGMSAGILGESKVCRESWWFNDDLRAKISLKQTCFKELSKAKEGPQEDKTRAEVRYAEAKKEAKKAVAKAKEKAYEEMYRRLDSKDGEIDIYKLAKTRERRRKDIGHIRCIKDTNGQVIVNEEETRKRWKEYFYSLFNDSRYRSARVESNRGGSRPHEECYYRRIKQHEVRSALSKMGRNKAVGPDQIPIEAWRCLGVTGVRWITNLFNLILRNARMPEDWRLSEVIPIYKNKGDVQTCSNYRGIKLLSHTMKLWERVIERRLRRQTIVAENQFGFMPGRSTMEAIHILRSLTEKYREKQKDLHMAFIDLEKAYDSVQRDLIWKTLDDRDVSKCYIKVIKDMYEGTRTRVRTPVGCTDYFPVEVGLHQGSALSPYLFTLILDKLAYEVQDTIPWCMLFADDIVLISETPGELNTRIEQWRRVLEDSGLRISREKTEYLRCNFSGNSNVGSEDMEICIENQILRPKQSFRYLGSIIHKTGKIDDDVTHRIQIGWKRWRAATTVLCDKNIPLKLKGKFYRVAVRPAMLYGSECWAMTKAQTNRMEVAEMRMLRWTCGKTLLDKIPVGAFRDALEVANIADKLREGRLRWYGHVRRRPQTAPVRRVEPLIIHGRRRRGRPRRKWEDRLKIDLNDLQLHENMTSDRNAWRSRISIIG